MPLEPSSRVKSLVCRRPCTMSGSPTVTLDEMWSASPRQQVTVNQVVVPSIQLPRLRS